MEGKLLVGLFLISLFVLCFALPPPKDGKLRKIKTSLNEEGHWAVEEEIAELLKNDAGFMDITYVNPPKNLTPRAAAIAAIPTELEFKDSVMSALEVIDSDRMRAFLIHFTEYHNRDYRVPSGEDAAGWLLDQIQHDILNSDYTGNITARFWNHEAWLQNSVFVRIIGSDRTLAEEVVIIGAHLDSVNTPDGRTGRAPGADDNASGCAVLLETLRIVLERDLVPERTVEFHFYAAEEAGLLGALDIANAYSHLDINVISMVNFDMASYTEGKKSIGLIRDAYTNSPLTQFLEYLVGNYSQFNTSGVVCGVPCSDHAAFTQYGFPAASPVNADQNLYDPITGTGIHTEHDSMELVNMPQLVEFTKLGLSYVMEVGKMGSGASALQISLGLTTAIIFSILHCF